MIASLKTIAHASPGARASGNSLFQCGSNCQNSDRTRSRSILSLYGPVEGIIDYCHRQYFVFPCPAREICLRGLAAFPGIFGSRLLSWCCFCPLRIGFFLRNSRYLTSSWHRAAKSPLSSSMQPVTYGRLSQRSSESPFSESSVVRSLFSPGVISPLPSLHQRQNAFTASFLRAEQPVPTESRLKYFPMLNELGRASSGSGIFCFTRSSKFPKRTGSKLKKSIATFFQKDFSLGATIWFLKSLNEERTRRHIVADSDRNSLSSIVALYGPVQRINQT